MAVSKLDPKVIFASEAPTQDTPATFINRTVGWGESRKNFGRPTIKQMNALQRDTDLKILWLNENAVTPFDETIDYPVGAVTIKDGKFKTFDGTNWDLFLEKTSATPQQFGAKGDGVTPHNLEQWDAIHIQGSDTGNFRGYFEVLSVPDAFTFTYSMEGYDPLPPDGSLTTGEVNVSKFMVADYNIITTNNFSNNRANSGEIPVVGGRRVMGVGSLFRCGANTEVGYNIGGDW